jgi:integrase
MTKVRSDTSITARALEFIVLTAARSGEAVGATWDEIDFEAKVWLVPASRMKADREHRVPLADAAIAVLKAMRAIRQSPYVFPGASPGQPVRGGTVWWLVNQFAGVSVHGLRSSFRDWASERTNFQREVCEQALAHAIPSAVEAAYRRGDLFEKRRKLMAAWAEFCAKPAAAGTVVAIGTRG